MPGKGGKIPEKRHKIPDKIPGIDNSHYALRRRKIPCMVTFYTFFFHDIKKGITKQTQMKG